MKLKSTIYPSHTWIECEGTAARALLKEVLHAIGQNIMIAEPPYTGIVRRRALERLKAGDHIWTDADPKTGQPRGTVVRMVPEVIGMIGEDGKYTALTDEGKKVDAAEVEGLVKARDSVQTDKD